MHSLNSDCMVKPLPKTPEPATHTELEMCVSEKLLYGKNYGDLIYDNMVYDGIWNMVMKHDEFQNFLLLFLLLDV